VITIDDDGGDMQNRMSDTTRRGMRHAGLALGIVALTLPLAACDSWSSTCDVESSCHITMSGLNRAHETPRPLDADEGVDNSTWRPDRISIQEATDGATATLVIGGEEHVCAAGESFTIADTTITCAEVGDDSIVPDTVRGG